MILTARELLPGMLALAVPPEIDRLRAIGPGGRAEVLKALQRSDLDAKAGSEGWPLGGGDALLFGGKGCAEAFAGYAQALAVLAFGMDGVTAFGLHFCASPHPECPGGNEPREEAGGGRQLERASRQ